jgi:hypothetical protein
MQNISKSLVKFQSELKPAGKDSVNPFFKSNYLSLSGILDHVLPILTSNGLSIVQPMKILDGQTVLITKLIHISGEFIESEMILPSHSDPQKYGSLITYYKRYQLQALLGISTSEEDTDGQDLVQKQPNNELTKPPKVNSGNLATQAQVNALKKKYPMTDEEIRKIFPKFEGWDKLAFEQVNSMFEFKK